MLAVASTVSRAFVEDPELWDRFWALENVAPASPERTKRMSAGVLSSQTTLMLPAPSTKSCGFPDKPGVADRFLGNEKVAPLSAERLREMSEWLAMSSSQSTLMLPFLSTAICGFNEPPVLVETMFGDENVAPPSL